MCCKEPENHFIAGMDLQGPVAVAQTSYEEDILYTLGPIWFGSKHGYQGKLAPYESSQWLVTIINSILVIVVDLICSVGTTHQNAEEFCRNIGDLTLCPQNAFCPSESNDKLFLNREPFEGEQWAPVGGTGAEVWISIGQTPHTCSSHGDLQLPQPAWAVDGSMQEVKKNVLSNLLNIPPLRNMFHPTFVICYNSNTQ